MGTTIKTYSELKEFKTFNDRFRYLAIGGSVGQETFGFERYANQAFYQSFEWKYIRDFVIRRDNGCDLGVENHEVPSRILIHHMNPISLRDILDRTDFLLNPEYLITVSHKTHNAIHYGDFSILEEEEVIERKPNDTCPWRK